MGIFSKSVLADFIKNIRTRTFSLSVGWEDGILLLEANISTE